MNTVPLFNAENMRPAGLSNKAWEMLERKYAKEMAIILALRTKLRYTHEVIRVGEQDFRVSDILENESHAWEHLILVEVLAALVTFASYKEEEYLRVALMNIASTRDAQGRPLYERHQFTIKNTLDLAAELLVLRQTRDTVISLSRLLREKDARIVYATYQTQADFIPLEDSPPYLDELGTYLPIDTETLPLAVTYFKLPQGFCSWAESGKERTEDEEKTEQDDVWWICFRGALAFPAVDEGGIPGSFAYESLSREEFYVCIAPHANALLYTDTEFSEFDYRPCLEAILSEIYQEDVVVQNVTNVSLGKLQRPKWEALFERKDAKSGVEMNLASATCKEVRGEKACNVTYSPLNGVALHTVSEQAPVYQKLYFQELTEVSIIFSFGGRGPKVLATLDAVHNIHSLEIKNESAPQAEGRHKRAPLAYAAEAMKWLVKNEFILPATSASSVNSLATSLRILLKGATRSYMKKACSPLLLEYAEKIGALRKIAQAAHPIGVVSNGRTYEILPESSDFLPSHYVRGKFLSAAPPPPPEERLLYQLSLADFFNARFEVVKNGGYVMERPHQIEDSGAYLVAGFPHRGERIFLTLHNSEYDLECIHRHCGSLSKKVIVITTDETALAEKYRKSKDRYSLLAMEYVLSNTAPLVDLIGCTVSDADTDMTPYKVFKHIKRIPERLIAVNMRGKGREEWRGAKIHLIDRETMRVTCEVFGGRIGEEYSEEYTINDVDFCCSGRDSFVTPYDLLIHMAFAKGDALDPIGELNELRCDMNTNIANQLIPMIGELAKAMNAKLKVFFRRRYDFFRNKKRSGTSSVKREAAKRYDVGDRTNIMKWNCFYFYLNVTAEEDLRQDYDELHARLRSALLTEQTSEVDKALEPHKRQTQYHADHKK